MEKDVGRQWLYKGISVRRVGELTVVDARYIPRTQRARSTSTRHKYGTIVLHGSLDAKYLKERHNYMGLI